MKNKIFPCIWFDGQAEEAARFYASVFADVVVRPLNSFVVTFEIAGQKFMCINGGPRFRPNPSLSFYTVCETESEIEAIWEQLTTGGKVLMPLDRYDWSEKYGWVEDRYGVSWQLTLRKVADLGQKFTPALMFVGEQFGQAEAAIQRYLSIFDDSTIHFIHRYAAEDELQGGKIAHSQFSLLGQRFVAIDSGFSHDFNFTEGLSLYIDCPDQAAIDHYWNRLSEGGSAGQCGWLKDAFGLSWQVVPALLPELMSDPEKAPRVMEAFRQMTKFDIETLINA